VRDHVRKLSQKSYWEKLDSPDFVVMFLPSEHIFSATVRADPSLVDYASDNRIIIVSPTLMISLLRVVGMSWRQVELAKNAQEISIQASELYKRLSVFGGHMEKVGKGLKSAIENYNNAVGSLERKVFPQARKMEDLHVQTGTKKLTEIDSIETMPRRLEITESIKKEKVS
jgi:DNA recombination protein RmuC